jgi:hypothetical protein
METTRSAEREAKRRFWEEHLGKWKSSGISQSEYCRLNDLALHRFIYWKKRLTRQGSPIALVEWPVVRHEGNTSSSLGPPLCIVIAGRYRIEINSGFDPAMLDCVVRVLRGL